MDTARIAALVYGHSEITRMRREINSIIGIVVGLVERDLWKLNEKSEFKLHSGEFIWAIDIGPWHGDFSPVVTVVCYRSKTRLFSICRAGTKSQPDGPQLSEVREVHDQLDLFVECMIREFPQLKEQLKPILTAAKREE